MVLPVVGDVSEGIQSYFEWRIPIQKIPNQESWKNDEDNGQSPSFQFWDATWKLEMWYDILNDGIQLYMVRKTWIQSRQNVAFKLNAIRKDGTEYEIDEGESEFTEECNETYFSLLEEKLVNKLAYDDNITIVCILYGKREITNTATRSTSSETDEDYSEETQTEDTEDKVTRTKVGTKDFENLSRHFKDLLLADEDSDVTVKVNDQEFPVHKLILRARSPVFDKMFRHGMIEKKEGVVDIRDCTPDAFKEFLIYLYSGEVEEFSRDTVFELYLLSDKYDVRGLKSASVEFMAEDLCIDTFCDVLHLALQHNEAVLLKKVTKFFTKNLKKIIVTNKWRSFIEENPIQANELYIEALNDVLPE